MDFKKIENKWQKKWSAAKLFESDPDKRKKFFITFPYPYVNGSSHIGHSFSACRVDAYARYKRMQGFNVLYPQGFHATGEPLVGALERLKQKDQVQIDTFKRFGATDKDLDAFIKKGPEFAAVFWMNKWIEELKLAGFSIDWRRSFITTPITPTYSRFIEWQYNTLKKKGYVVKGTHPVIWCPKCQSPTGDHDRLEGVGESPINYILMKFQFDDYILPAGTLRPETIYGVTNIWVNPEVEYVKAVVDNEKWIISKECAEKLKDQLKSVEIIGKISGDALLGKRCIEPLSRKSIPILPSDFVDPKSATGIVMSVPSHAPYDWIAIKELIEGDLERYSVERAELEPISLITTPGYGEHPAIEQCKKMGIKSLKQADKLDEATSIVYKKEFHQGRLNEKCDEYAGMMVSECKDKLSIDFIEKNISDMMWDCSSVVCRCTASCHVKILENQWFLKFSDDEWKNLARKCLSKMTIYPEEARTNFNNTIDWLKDKACARKSGLGTPMPWDNAWLIETLSDSTIYMAYYTIAKIINEKKLPAEKLTDVVFDYIFLNKKLAGKIEKIIEDMKKEFEYYYPVDFRGSGKDLIQNHLTFFIFHHTAIWPESQWPKCISVNGYVNIEGEKMSKSKGNIIPMKDLLDQFGADLTRINIIASTEGIDDADWRAENIKSYRARLEFLADVVEDIKSAKRSKLNNADIYLQSKIQKSIGNATESYEITKFRTALHHAFFENINAIKWYLKRAGDMKNANKKVLYSSLSAVLKMLAPITPHICEELWEKLGNKPFISLESWPKADKHLIDEKAESYEDFVRQVAKDVEEIQEFTKIKPKKASIFIADSWKFNVLNSVLENKEKSPNEVISELMKTELKKHGSAVAMFVQSLYKRVNELYAVEKDEQLKIIMEAAKFLEKELNCKIEIIDAEKSTHAKARSATPMKPGILLK